MWTCLDCKYDPQTLDDSEFDDWLDLENCVGCHVDHIGKLISLEGTGLDFVEGSIVVQDNVSATMMEAIVSHQRGQTVC